jgi:AraC-like DNA-binding protein
VEAIELYVQTAGLNIGTGGFRVVVAAVTDEPDSEGDHLRDQRLRVLAVRMLAENFEGRMHLQTVEADRIAVLLIDQHPFGLITLTQQLNGIAALLLNRYGFRLYFACGEIIDDLQEAPRQFRQLTDHLDLAGADRSSLVFVDEVSTPQTFYRYPIDTEMQLLTLLKMGDRSAAMGVLRRVVADNRNSPGANYSELFRAISGTYLRCANELFSPEEYRDIRLRVEEVGRAYDADDFLSKSGGLIDHLSGRIDSRRESHNTELRTGIAEYLKKHYGDPMLNLYAVAKVFELNEKYLSRFFRDQTGETFSSHLEKIRMDRAASLLLTTDATIDVIAGSVGYTSTNTFHKAFRRVYSTSPGRYRQEVARNSDRAV